MDEKRLQEQVPKAVQQHCAHLSADPFLAQRVIREADRKEPVYVKKKMKFGLILALILMLLTATAVAAVLLSGMELVEQEAVPLAQANDGEVRPNMEYSNEELYSILTTAAENGIVITDGTILQALQNGEGYSEEEVIMEICREAFGGLYYEWTVEQRHFFHDMIIAIGYQSGPNTVALPGPDDLTGEEARALARETVWKHYGAEIPLEDESKYRVEEDFYGPDNDTEPTAWWSIHFYPRTLEGATYYIAMDSQGEWVNHNAVPQDWSTYTERQLQSGIDITYGYRTRDEDSWSPEAWYVFGQMLPQAEHSDRWSEEFDAYLATTYLLPGESDMPMEDAISLALKDSDATATTDPNAVLIGKGDQRIWKVSFYQLDGLSMTQLYACEIDSMTHEILGWQTQTFGMSGWSRFVLKETYEAIMADAGATMTEEEGIARAIQALHEHLGRTDIPFGDQSVYETDVRYLEYLQYTRVTFKTKVMDWGNASVSVYQDGRTEIDYADEPELTGDNLFSRFERVYDSDIYWEQSRWVEFGEAMKNYEPTTFEGKLFKQTTYLPESAVKITRDQAMDIVYIDGDHATTNRIVLIDAEPNPVWKVRADTQPVTTLYEIDAMTGEILDKELYFIQEPNFDHTMKMYTLRKDFMPAYLAEYGVTRVAMELCVKAYAEEREISSPDYLISGSYRITEEGMTVTFMSIDPRKESYVVTVAEDAMSAEIEVIPGKPEAALTTDDATAEALCASYQEGGHFKELVLPEDFWLYDVDPGKEIQGAMTMEEARAHAFKLLVKAVGKEMVETYPDLAVSYTFDTITRSVGDEEQPRWRFIFVNPDNPAEGWKVTFAIWDGVPEEGGDVKPVADQGNG